jgi:benzoate/toluate 1,2-dioxygenase alpha subunit
VARFELRGFLFGSLKAGCAPLEHSWASRQDHRHDRRPVAEGLEVLRGSSTYTFEGNWKLQAENGADGYHVTAVHWNYAATTNRRKEAECGGETRSAPWTPAPGDARVAASTPSSKGHMLLWSQWANPEDRPNLRAATRIREKYGKPTADWMVGRSRNLCLYPNVYLMDQFSSQIRVLRPISVDKTEVTIYCIAPKGESRRARAHRIRQYEDFFNVSGMATPDDLEEFRACQQGYQGSAMRVERHVPWRRHWIQGRRGGERHRPAPC